MELSTQCMFALLNVGAIMLFESRNDTLVRLVKAVNMMDVLFFLSCFVYRLTDET